MMSSKPARNMYRLIIEINARSKSIKQDTQTYSVYLGSVISVVCVKIGKGM
jgi:hypothetical protein